MTEPVEQTSIEENLVEGSERLLFFFGGIAGAIGMPPFEFYRAAEALEHSRVFLRDPSQAWYQRGLPELGPDALSIGKYLEKKVVDSGATEVRFVGNSMGGFAALLFCAMLRGGSAIAFAPQAFVSVEKRRQHGDERWSKEVGRLHAAGRPSDILDLKPWIAKAYPEIRAQVFVGTSDALDKVHAAELSEFENVHIHGRSDGGHGLVRALREEGALAEILNGGDGQWTKHDR